MRILLCLAIAADIVLLGLISDTCLAAEPPTGHEVAIEKNAPTAAKDKPLTAVAVTQCNLVVAVYVTTADGRLLRFDHTSGISAESLLEMAYTAVRSERVEVGCSSEGVVGYERHDPV